MLFTEHTHTHQHSSFERIQIKVSCCHSGIWHCTWTRSSSVLDSISSSIQENKITGLVSSDGISITVAPTLWPIWWYSKLYFKLATKNKAVRKKSKRKGYRSYSNQQSLQHRLNSLTITVPYTPFGVLYWLFLYFTNENCQSGLSLRVSVSHFRSTCKQKDINVSTWKNMMAKWEFCVWVKLCRLHSVFASISGAVRANGMVIETHSGTLPLHTP